MILALNTASENAFLQLISSSGEIIKKKEWQAGRNLTSDLAREFENILKSDDKLTGLIVFSGPGSFTGLRIGISMINALAYSLDIPLVGVGGDDWLEVGFSRLENNENDRVVNPNYGKEANITLPKK